MLPQASPAVEQDSAFAHTSYEELDVYDTAPGTEGAPSLVAIARSYLLSQEDADVPVDTDEITNAVARKNSTLAAGQKQRWEKTLKGALRNYLCFISHGRHGARSISYTCDRAVNPHLKRTGSSSTRTSSVETLSNNTSPQPSDRNMSKPSPIPMKEATTRPALFDFDVSELYEEREPFRLRRVFYVLQVGPKRVRRLRATGQLSAGPVLSLLRLIHGSSQGEKAFREGTGWQVGAARPAFLHSHVVKGLIAGTSLEGPMRAVLDDSLPIIGDLQPLTRHLKPEKYECRYCGACFTYGGLQHHHERLQGICQLEAPGEAQAYLRILRESLDDSDQSEEEPDEENALSFSRPIIPPTFPFWTESEMDLFFAALKRHSKLHPDWIAKHVGSKSSSEVQALIDQLESASALLDANESRRARRPAAEAREMSDEWVKKEEQLSEDVIVWDAFVEQSLQTPLAFRDLAQQGITMGVDFIACEQCQARATACDGQGPTCRSCRKRKRHCTWHSVLMSSACGDAVKASFPAAHSQASELETIQSHFKHNLSWQHLIALGCEKDRSKTASKLDTWWQTSNVALDRSYQYPTESSPLLRDDQILKIPKLSRRLVSETLQTAGLGSISNISKEALYDELKAQPKTAGFKEPDAVLLVKLFESEAVRKRSEALEATIARHEAMAPVDALSQLERARRWTSIPLCQVSARSGIRQHDHLQDIIEEVKLASRQLNAVSIRRKDLGSCAELFNLRKLGIMLDLYRRESEVKPHISHDTIQALYTMVHQHVKRLIALTICHFLSHGDVSGHYEGKRRLWDSVKAAILEVECTPSKARRRPHRTCDDAVRALGNLTGSSSIENNAKASPSHTATQGIAHLSKFEPGPLLSSYTAETSDHDGSSSEDDASGFEMDSEAEEAILIKEAEKDRRSMESDLVRDHIYESRLWETLRDGVSTDVGGQEKTSADKDEVEDTPQADMDSDTEVSTASSEVHHSDTSSAIDESEAQVDESDSELDEIEALQDRSDSNILSETATPARLSAHLESQSESGSGLGSEGLNEAIKDADHESDLLDDMHSSMRENMERQGKAPSISSSVFAPSTSKHFASDAEDHGNGLEDAEGQEYVIHDTTRKGKRRKSPEAGSEGQKRSKKRKMAMAVSASSPFERRATSEEQGEQEATPSIATVARVNMRGNKGGRTYRSKEYISTSDEEGL